MPGKKIGKYQLGETLGEGNYGKVKLAKHVETGQRFAVKIVQKSRLREEGLEEQMKREITVQKMLVHRNVVRLFEVMQTDNNIYLVLELITGGELFDRIIQKKRFDEDTARRYFQELIVGLFYCHQQGVAHRDLKPENLLLDDQDHIKITDFGLSNYQKTPEGSTEAGPAGALLQTVCGTPNYVAPEVLKTDDTGEGYNGFTADVWTCGVILFVMVAGYLPFDDQSGNLNALFTIIQRGEYRFPRNPPFSAELQDLVRRILITDPKKRYTLEDIMRHKWFSKDFDASQVEAFRGVSKVQPTAEQVKNWATKAEETGEKEKKKGPATDGFNAFQLIDKVTGNVFQALLSSDFASEKEGQQSTMRRSSPCAMLKVDGKTGIESVTKAMKELSAAPQPTKADPTIIKGAITQRGVLTFACSVTPTVSSKLTLISVRKTKGDTLRFHKVYDELLAKLGSIVVPFGDLGRAAEAEGG
eukprot:TRINITY_DN881_c0_g1_i1.p1 TRINITY_DN881_c0_g1~~TRINITY_DN881_c0_g1_i1.p1  ORF type:complete len:498 (+),score=232.59 TRINITY_DN881_c0_g1_i1:80-1495(+)